MQAAAESGAEAWGQEKAGAPELDGKGSVAGIRYPEREARSYAEQDRLRELQNR